MKGILNGLAAGLAMNQMAYMIPTALRNLKVTIEDDPLEFLLTCTFVGTMGIALQWHCLAKAGLLLLPVVTNAASLIYELRL